MKKYILIVFAGLLAVSCVDTVILPDSKTVDEDFWKSKSDVQLVVNRSYQLMLSSDLIARLTVWGDLRSDEVLPVTTVSNTTIREALTQIHTGNTQYDNTYATWGSFYSVINYCNIVLKKAEGVMQEDPSYTQGDYLADCSQMLALRSLCYFYLVRNFRDVPYTTEGFMNSSQDVNLPQSAPDSVLTCCLRDLEVAEKNAISASAYSDWRRVGYFTRDGIQALMADIYLWLGSVRHSAADYEKAIEYCDKVIESKRAQHRLGFGENEAPEYPLAEGRTMFNELFITMNAEESIFELQFNGTDNGNLAICQFYNRYNGGNYPPYVRAANIFGYGKTGNTAVYATGNNTNDYRGLMNTYSSSTDELDIRKYVDLQPWSPASVSSSGGSITKARSDRAYSTGYRQNYIIYRLTDVMLMKAEALMALCTSEEDVQLRQAFNLVQAVNARAIELKTDSMRWNTYNTTGTAIASIEKLILAERLRELAFEGKRWYDLMRFNYRHVNGVDYTTTLFDQDDRGVQPVDNYQDMLDLMVRKFSSGGNAVAAKLRTEPLLYMPVPKTDMEVSPALRQNPAYSMADEYSKNY